MLSIVARSLNGVDFSAFQSTRFFVAFCYQPNQCDHGLVFREAGFAMAVTCNQVLIFGEAGFVMAVTCVITAWPAGGVGVACAAWVEGWVFRRLNCCGDAPAGFERVPECLRADLSC